MRLLFLGDVVGNSGVDFLEKNIYKLKKDYAVDFTIVNGENSAKGNGITPKSFNDLVRLGADVVTTGNHCFRRKEMEGLYDSNDILLRPANFPEGVVGRGYTVIDLGRVSIAVINLMGTVYLDALDNPFNVMDRLLERIGTPNIIVDLHAEATAEKKARGHYLDGKVTAVLGTHTHVQTADEAILPGGTAYITDVGMTGAELSVLGVETALAIDKLRTHCPVTFRESTNPCFLNAVCVEFNENTGRAVSIERIQLR